MIIMNAFTSIFHEKVIDFYKPETYIPKRAVSSDKPGEIISKPEKKDSVKIEGDKNSDQSFLHTAAYGNKNDRKRLRRAEAEAKKKTSVKESFLNFDII